MLPIRSLLLASLIPSALLGAAPVFAQDIAPTAPAVSDSPLSPKENAQLRLLLEKQKAVANKTDQSSGAASLASENEKRKGLHALLKDSWFERLSIRGYMQLRTTSLLGKDNHNGAAKSLVVPADSTVSESRSLTIRRGRVVISGDASSHLYVYTQMDFNGSVGPSGGDSGVQARDYYADISIDEKKEFRFRVGQSKVPFGFVNLQSSQNRAPMERPDALNSAVEGERDLGVYAMWAPEDKRKLFKDLVAHGLKGSGDYGVLTAGAYSGQGLNRSDANGDFHYVARAACPFELEDGQIFEVGVQAYSGKFAPPSTVGYRNNNAAIAAPVRNAAGLDDRRAAATFVWFPQPFGFEAEWMVGEGPELNTRNNRIEVQSLSGGYAMVDYRIKADGMEFFPFIRYSQYQGGRKFAANAPGEKVRELDVGIEFSPWKEVELTAMYTHTFDRTNTTDVGAGTRNAYGNLASGADRLGIQCQINF